MKKSFFFFTLFFSAISINAQISLSGSFTELSGNNLTIEKPYNGKFFPSVPEKIEILQKETFSLEWPDKHPGFYKIHLDGFAPVRIYLTPGDKLILIGEKKGDKPDIKFQGSGAAQNQFLQNLKRLPLPESGKLANWKNGFLNTPATPKDVWLAVQNQLMAEQKMLKKAAKEEGFSTAFLAAVEADIQYYYACVLSSIVMQEWKKSLLNGQPFDLKWVEYWTKLFTDKNINHLEAAVSEWYLAFLRHYISEYRLEFMQENEFADADTLLGEQFLEYDRLMWKYFPAHVQEYAVAAIFSAAALRGRNEAMLPELFQKYQNDFSQSQWLPLFETAIRLVKPVKEENKNDFPQGIFHIDPSDEINNLQDLLKPFRGKVIYLDIWATWCTPCLFEFKKRQSLEKYAAGKDIVFVYVSVDNEERYNRWRQIIEENNLTGYHIMANFLLREELINNYGDGETLPLPRYMIFNKKGKLVEQHAKQPSHEALLFRQLDKYLAE